jgi:hypothetical protein
MRISNQTIKLPGSIQVTDEYACSDTFPNSYDAENYYEWCVIEAERMKNCFVYEDIIEVEGEIIPVCHVRRCTDAK